MTMFSCRKSGSFILVEFLKTNVKLQTLEMKELSTCGQHQKSSFPGPPVSHPNSVSDKDQHEQ